MNAHHQKQLQPLGFCFARAQHWPVPTCPCWCFWPIWYCFCTFVATTGSLAVNCQWQWLQTMLVRKFPNEPNCARRRWLFFFRSALSTAIPCIICTFFQEFPHLFSLRGSGLGFLDTFSTKWPIHFFHHIRPELGKFSPRLKLSKNVLYLHSA